MLKHETKLINPGEGADCRNAHRWPLMTRTSVAARLLADDPAKWRRFARQATTEPEGHSMFRGGKGGVPATQVLAAWWTDWIGRKHVVVRGRRLEHDETKRMLHKEELDSASGVVARVPRVPCRRRNGKQSQIVRARAVCGGGHTGDRSAGWAKHAARASTGRKNSARQVWWKLPRRVVLERALLGEVVCSPDGTRARLPKEAIRLPRGTFRAAREP